MINLGFHILFLNFFLNAISDWLWYFFPNPWYSSVLLYLAQIGLFYKLYILIFLVCCLIREQLPFLQSWKSLSYYFFKYFFFCNFLYFFSLSPGLTVEHMLQPLHLPYMFCTIYPFVPLGFFLGEFPRTISQFTNLCFNYIQLCLPFLTYLNTVIYSQWFLIVLFHKT